MNTTMVIAIVAPFVLIAIISLVTLAFMKQSVNAYAYLAKRAEYERQIMELDAKKNKELAKFVFGLCKSICQGNNIDDIVYRFSMLKCVLTMIEFDDDTFIINSGAEHIKEIRFEYAELTEQLYRLLEQESAKEAVGDDAVNAFDKFMKLVEGIHKDELDTYQQYAEADYQLKTSAGVDNATRRHVIIKASKRAAKIMESIIDSARSEESQDGIEEESSDDQVVTVNKELPGKFESPFGADEWI